MRGEVGLGHFPSALQSFPWSAPEEPRGAVRRGAARRPAAPAAAPWGAASPAWAGASASPVDSRGGSAIAVSL